MKTVKPVIIGGEKVFPLSLLFSRDKNNLFADLDKVFKNYQINFTFGGYFSLLSVLDDLNINKEKELVLLPSYLCQSILKPFDIRGIRYKFYKVDSELKPDINHIDRIITKDVKAILFVDYMGRNCIKQNISWLNNLKGKGIKIIQDCVQAIDLCNIDIYGDYVFNSFRKYLPFEGSVLLSRNKMEIEYARGINLRFLFYKRTGQIIRYFHLKYRGINPELFLHLFEKAEIFYYSPKIFRMPSLNGFLIRKINLKILYGNYLKFFRILYEKFSDATLKSIGSDDYQPFGFLLVSHKRNEIKDLLQEKGIFCPVHWKLSEKIDKVEFSSSIQLSDSLLTIPLGSLSDRNIDYLCQNIEDIL